MAALASAIAGCGSQTDDVEATAASALTANEVFGFETLDSWHTSSGTAALTTTRTQGAAAFGVTAPQGFAQVVSAAIDSTAPGLVGLSNAGSVMALDFELPTQQPNQFFFGGLQLSVSVPSRNVFSTFLAQVNLTGLPVGTFQTLRFAIPDSLRNALRGATFSDMTFTFGLSPPSGATGTYIFDNLRVEGTTAADFTLTPNPAAVTVARGTSATSTVTIARSGGFASAVTFSAAGLPAGVTATFAPATTTTTGTSTVVTFTAAANATAGTATVTVTGSGGGLARGATIGLTVPAPTFTLAVQPANVTVIQNESGFSTVTITPLNGFVASTVTFTANGVPAGVTPTFHSFTATQADVIFAVSSAAAPGTTTVTIVGTGSGVTSTTTIALTVVPPPDFTLTAAPPTVTAVHGGNGSTTLNITQMGPVLDTIAMSISGTPPNTAVTFDQFSTQGPTVTMTVLTASGVPPGSYPFQVIGTSFGGIAHSVTVTLIVTAQ